MSKLELTACKSTGISK